MAGGDIIRYRVFLNGAGSVREIGAQIALYDVKGQIGLISFYRTDGVGFSGQDVVTAGGWIHMSRPMSEFQATVDVLRNEGPMQLVYQTPQVDDAYGQIITGKELVGEGQT